MMKAHTTSCLTVLIAVACLLSPSTEARDRSPGPDAVEVDAFGLQSVHVVRSNETKMKFIVAQSSWRPAIEDALVGGDIGMEKTKKPDTQSKSNYSTEKAAKSPSKKRVNKRKN